MSCSRQNHETSTGRGGTIAVLYETHSTSLTGPSWKGEANLQHSCWVVLLYSGGTQTNNSKQTDFTNECGLEAFCETSPVLRDKTPYPLAVTASASNDGLSLSKRPSDQTALTYSIKLKMFLVLRNSFKIGAWAFHRPLVR